MSQLLRDIVSYAVSAILTSGDGPGPGEITKSFGGWTMLDYIALASNRRRGVYAHGASCDDGSGSCGLPER